MFKRSNTQYKLEKNNKFVDRVLVLSIPSTLVFLMLVVLHLLSPSMAIISYATIILFNVICLLPLSFEMQQLKNYVKKISHGEFNKDEYIELSEHDAQEIIEAVNSMHRFWTTQNDNLEAQTISDAAVLDTLPDPLLMIDKSGNIIGANLSSRTLFGNDVTHENIEHLIPSNNFISAVSKVLNKEEESENLIFYLKKPSTQKLYAHIKQLPYLSKGKAVAVIALYNLTKAMRIEKMQSDFVANASHELRTPLAVISGFIETLQTTAKDDVEARDKFLKIMQEQATYMSSLIENLLSLSKIEISQDLPPQETVNIAKIINEVCGALSLKAQAREIQIHSFIEPNLPLITADVSQVKQIIQNLTDNAIKYGVAKSDLLIKAKVVDQVPPSKSFKVAPGKAVAISINNKGPKIAPENLARLTERFYRMQEHKNLNIKGTGLGLAIAKHIIIRHRGNLTVNSTSYNGTTFIIYLPLHIQES